MRANITVKLLNKYAACPKCGSDKIGKDQGSLVVKDKIFHRSCGCGWSITEKEEDHVNG